MFHIAQHDIATIRKESNGNWYIYITRKGSDTGYQAEISFKHKESAIAHVQQYYQSCEIQVIESFK